MATNSLNKKDPLVYRSRPHAGRWGGWLGNVANYNDTLTQRVTVPAGASKLVLTFWRQVRSAEPAGSDHDRLTVQFSTDGGQPIGSPLVITSAARRNAWVKETATLDLAGYSGPAVLSFSGQNDGRYVSSFYIDDVSLVTTCP